MNEDLFLSISKVILDTNYKTPESLSKFLKSQFAIMSVMKSEAEKKSLLKELESLLSEMKKIRFEIKRLKFDKKLGRYTDEHLLNKRENDLKNVGYKIETLKIKISEINNVNVSASNVLHQSKQNLFVRNLKEVMIREFGREKQKDIFSECHVSHQQLSDSITIE